MGPVKRHEEPEPLEEAAVSTPLGKLTIKGGGIIAIVTLLVGLATLYLVSYTNDGIANQRVVTAARYAELSGSMKAMVKAQTLMTCIFSVTEARREQEYRDSNSYCRRMIEQ